MRRRLPQKQQRQQPRAETARRPPVPGSTPQPQQRPQNPAGQSQLQQERRVPSQQQQTPSQLQNVRRPSGSAAGQQRRQSLGGQQQQQRPSVGSQQRPSVGSQNQQQRRQSVGSPQQQQQRRASVGSQQQRRASSGNPQQRRASVGQNQRRGSQPGHGNQGQLAQGQKGRFKNSIFKRKGKNTLAQTLSNVQFEKDIVTGTFDEGESKIQNDLVHERKKKGRKGHRYAIPHSDMLHDAHHPLHLTMLIFGRIPFKLRSKADGTRTFRYSHKNGRTIYFFCHTILSMMVFVMMTFGLVALYLDVNQSEKKDLCEFTWETYLLTRHIAPMTIAYSFIFLTIMGNLYICFYGKELMHFLNFWHRSVGVMDMDVTAGVKGSVIRENIEFILLASSLVCVYATHIVGPIHDLSGLISNSLFRVFVRDVGIREYPDFKSFKKSGFGCINGVPKSGPMYTSLKIVGLLIFIYSFYCSRCFIILFKFFCKLLRNAAFIWNQRLWNSLHYDEQYKLDQTRRRLEIEKLWKDHLIIVQLFKLTESCFKLLLQVFYLALVVNLCVELFFMSYFGSKTTCEQILDEIIASNCLKNNETENAVNFEDTCVTKFQFNAKVQDSLIVVILFIYTIHDLFSVTTCSSNAYETAMRGFEIVRRHGFMFAKDTSERNFIHSLVLSFARNNPMNISAGGYFLVTRRLISVIIGASVSFLIILLNYRPYSIDQHKMQLFLKDLCSGNSSSSSST